MDRDAQTARGVPLSTLDPKFLHTNSTSHTVPFSAIAELIDNAYDPDVNAKHIWIDKTKIKGKDCLTFMDNGNGLNWKKMHQMLSFGYSDKKAVGGKLPIGMYGNGFKSGSMRLGQDVIVFSKSEKDLCVGMLSQSYLKETGAERITVPIISIKEPREQVLEEHKASLKDILDHSPFNTEEELLTELKVIKSTGSTTGTRIIIWNLRRTSAGNVEFDFTTDRYDIRIPPDVFDSEAAACRSSERSDSSVPESGFSLRAYCSILYMKPRMQINIRGQKVKTQLISKSLAYIAKDIYRPSYLKQKIPIIFGYNTKSKEQYGIMMYHKNRLIKAYLRVGCQLNPNRQGIGVIGVIECNFLKPTHNKQDFDYTDNYRNVIRNVATKLEEYCKEIRYKGKKNNPSDDMLIEETEKQPDQNWVQCDRCQQWRRLPDGIKETLPEEWFCSMNPDPQFRLCETEEEPEDSDSEQPTYPKSYKIHEREKKKKQDKMKEASSLNTPQTPEQGASASSVAPGHPVITEVFSLAKSPSRMKRRQPLTPQSQSKRRTASSVKRTLDTYLTPVPRDDVNHDHNPQEGSRAPVLKEPTICMASGSPASLEAGSTGNDATEVRDTSAEMQGPRVKEEEEMDVCTAANDGVTVKKEGSLDINQAQEQQDQLVELLHTVSSERDSLKEMLNKLQAQLMEEKERAGSQAQYKLYEQARKKAEELSRENEALLQAHANVLQQNQEQAKEVEVLTNRLDQSRHKLEELHLKMNQLEEDKASISAEYEKIRSNQTQLRNKVANLFNGI